MNDTLFSLKTFVHTNTKGLKAVVSLFQDLHTNEIRYCHWKSNIRLEQSVFGKTDLDLLVERSQSKAFKQILLAHDIKPIAPPPGQQYPGMEHYLGFDPSSGKLFHLHIHYQLVLGEAYIKNFRLPLERVFLNQTRKLDEIYTPIPELEIGILCIRVLLKYRSRDAIKDIFSIRSPGIKQAFRDELAWLLQQTSLPQIDDTLQRFAPLLPRQIILEFLSTVSENPRDGLKWLKLQRQLRKALKIYQRQNQLTATASYLKELWTHRKSFLWTSPASGLKLPQGGLTIALLGADGAGKSTLCAEISDWLSWKLDVQPFYLGSKKPSALSKVLYLVFRISRRIHRAVASRLPEKGFLSRQFAQFRDFFLYLHHLSNGRDRLQRYAKGSRLATEGSVVIFDRFPVSSFDQASNAHLLDGPRLQELAAGREYWFSQRLCTAEQNTYAKMQAPDVIVFLQVSPEISIQRKPDHQEAVIRLKSETITHLANRKNWEQADCRSIQIDADQPYDQVLSQLKQELWKLL